ncbi:SMP-30/gluconolactonase/LRE family protein [Halomonas sp. 18H]|uniref:SMP-30/gluconolactonase/LRE family protein n=1 Tax=Halomonas almeriensis TaxID=308163 RepID=UPI0022326ED0|nr:MULTISPECIES: SMP-30/gluconolactonase/LRE family protein [Halomonas]MCW4153377.1 SMP-30/gluconolactonase/LRE family protein [Halomonas sp. 18H]MDN3553804.1 SMP-30/gluconolactonase/LRE family protein [Halomonas almeriensis]
MTARANAVEVALPLDMDLGESPVWSVADQTLYWVDINRGRVFAWASGDAAPNEHDFAHSVGCLALSEQGLLVAEAPALVWLDPRSGERWPTNAVNPEWEVDGGNRFNDGRCDPAGRFWVGTLNPEDGGASLYSWREGHLVAAKRELRIANGLAFSPDARWLYHTDSPSRRVLRHAFDPESGELGEGKVWIDLDAHDLPGVPDGAAVDKEGHYWSALYGGARIARFDPDGQLLAEYPVPCSNPTMVAFGGVDLKTLFITTARQEMDQAALQRYPLAGSLLSLRVSTPGLEEPSVTRR